MRSPLRTLYLCELKLLLRDRRTIFASIVLPILVMPLILFSTQMAEKGRQERTAEATYRYTVVGPAAELARELLAEGEQSVEGGGVRLEEVTVTEPVTALEMGEISAWVEAWPAGDWPEGVPETEQAPVLPFVRVAYLGNLDDSQIASRALGERLEAGVLSRRAAALEARGFPLPAAEVATLMPEDVATAGQVTGWKVGRFATVFLVLLLLAGGSVVAADTLAGEKERGTLETLLTTAASRTEIVVAKQLVIFTVALAIVAIQLLNLLVYIGLELVAVPEGFAVELSPLSVLLLVLFLVPLAAFASSVLLWASGRAKTYKEFQVVFFPIFVALALPAAAAVVPNLTLRSAVVLVPIANVSIAVRDVLVGRNDWPMLALAWAVMAAATVWTMRAALASLSSERLVTASDLDHADLTGGSELFEKRVPVAFAAMWVILFLSSTSTLAAGGIRAQLAFNLLVVFLGGSLWLLRRYRVPLREALSWRAPRPATWLAVAIGAPCGLVVSLGLAKLSFALFPLPSRWLEAFIQQLLPQEMSLVESLLWLALLPAICEEIAFRGALLRGLRRLRPAWRVVAVALVFGLFHFQAVRFLQTAFLGALLALLVLWSGSIFPAMLWHALNNATALLAGEEGLDLDTLGAGTVTAAVAGLALALVIVWRERRQRE